MAEQILIRALIYQISYCHMSFTDDEQEAAKGDENKLIKDLLSNLFGKIKQFTSNATLNNEKNEDMFEK